MTKNGRYTAGKERLNNQAGKTRLNKNTINPNHPKATAMDKNWLCGRLYHSGDKGEAALLYTRLRDVCTSPVPTPIKGEVLITSKAASAKYKRMVNECPFTWLLLSKSAYSFTNSITRLCKKLHSGKR